MDLRRLGESSRLFTVKDGNKYRIKKTYLPYARALRLCWGSLLGSILDLDSTFELAKISQINVTTRSSRDLQHGRVSHKKRHQGMRSRRQYISALNHEVLCCKNQKRKFSRGRNGVRRLSWHSLVVPSSSPLMGAGEVE